MAEGSLGHGGGDFVGNADLAEGACALRSGLPTDMAEGALGLRGGLLPTEIAEGA